MAHYDKATQDFIDHVSDSEKKHPDTKDIARTAMGLARDFSKGKAHIPEAIAKRVLKVGINSLEKDGGINPLSIYEMLNSHYGSDWQSWAPETMWKMLGDEHAITPTEEIRNLIGALQVICKTDFAFEDFSVFEKVCHAINFHPVLFGTTQPCELDAIAMTVHVLQEIRHRGDYEDDILAYIAACAKHAGVVYLPEDLFPKGSQKFLDEMGNNIELKTKVATGNIDHVMDEDVQLQHDKLSEIREYVNG